MKIMSRSFYYILPFLFVAISTQAQDDSLKRILQKFDYYINHAYQEKVYVHTDRTFYLTGDFLWFKAYIVDGVKHQPSDLNKVAYIEILDGNNVPVIQSKLELEEGSGNSAIFLPASLNSGHYILRAYTRWMQNFSPEMYFQKVITIVNPFKPLPQNAIDPEGQFDAQYFPEGGDLVEGLQSKVAFRVVDKNGKGVPFTGWIIDQDYDTAATFAPLKFGMGNFVLTPQPGKQYRAVVKDPSGNILNIKQLVQAKKDGYSISLKEEGNKITVNVYARFEDGSLKVVHMLMHSNGKVVTSGTKALHENSTSFTIDRNDIPSGITHLTIFDRRGQPVCERLYFKNPEAVLHLSAKVNKQNFVLREKTTIAITTTNQNNEGIQADLSAAVFRLDSLQKDDSMDIVNYLLLTSDLKGSVESPSYYFSNEPGVREAVDNLMLTHGWRRFQWRDVLSDRKPVYPFIPEYRGHLVMGSVHHEITDDPGVNIPAYLSIPGRRFQLRGTKSNRSGELKFELKDFYGPGKMIVQTNTQLDSVYRIKIANPFSEKFTDVRFHPLDLNASVADQLASRSMAMQLENAYFEQERGKIMQTTLDTVPFYGKPDEQYRLDEFTRFPVMEEVMREYVPGILVRKRKQEFYFITINDNDNSVFRDNPLVLLDGIPIFRINTIMEYDPARIESLDVMTKKYFYGPLSFPGVASYFTYDGDYPDLPIDDHALVLDYEGLLWKREFFSPVYETNEQKLSRLPDSRNLLYWSPSIATDQNGKGAFEFYTSDQPGEYIVQIQGLNKDGLCGSTTLKFQVTSPPSN